MKKVILSIVISVFYLSCGKIEVLPEGTIEGRFEIGPLCGVEPITADEQHPCGLSFEALDKIYEVYKVQLINTNTSAVVAEKKMDHTGMFSFTVPEGSYNLDYTPHILYGSNKPSSDKAINLAVKASQVTTVNITVNTGLR
ncbi:hypothetical protein [Emticicia sp. SJ17W-69]|uniref:hypothetical protein n=1 Tax=Emticicia sp. SJ17W-69 TaxID=3421657 RepID=UPI003EB89C18